MDKKGAKMKPAPAGVSIRNGPVTDDKMDIDEHATNGNSKRKARASISRPVKYNEDDESDEDAVPLVCRHPLGGL